MWYNEFISRFAVLKTDSYNRGARSRRLSLLLIPYIWIIGFIAVITVSGKALERTFDLVNIVLLYLLPVLIAAVRWGLWPSLAASLLGILSFDFFFVPPVMSFTVHDVHYLLSFAIFLLVAFVTGTLAARLRAQAHEAEQRERRTAALYLLSHKIAAETDIQQVLTTIVDTVSTSIGADIAILMPGGTNGSLQLAAVSRGSKFVLDEKEQAIVQWVFEHRQEAGPGTSTLDEANRLFVPVHDGERPIAVLALPTSSRHTLSREQRDDLDALASLTALAITRLQLAEEAEQVKWLAESEKLHTALLNAVSHDLRTPLSSITGAVTGLLSEPDRYNAETKKALLTTIKEGAQRMNRFVTNLLDMARLESGILKLNREWCDMLDIVGVALKEAREMLPDRRFSVQVPEELPMVRVDFTLIEQVLINLLENGAKYSPPDSSIAVSVAATETELTVSVTDQGTPVPENDRDRIFDKFYRLRSARHVSGSGLGLSICKGIVEAHGGRIWAASRSGTGNTFILSLPLEADPDKTVTTIEENHGE